MQEYDFRPNAEVTHSNETQLERHAMQQLGQLFDAGIDPKRDWRKQEVAYQFGVAQVPREIVIKKVHDTKEGDPLDSIVFTIVNRVASLPVEGHPDAYMVSMHELTKRPNIPAGITTRNTLLEDRRFVEQPTNITGVPGVREGVPSEHFLTLLNELLSTPTHLLKDRSGPEVSGYTKTRPGQNRKLGRLALNIAIARKKADALRKVA